MLSLFSLPLPTTLKNPSKPLHDEFCVMLSNLSANSLIPYPVIASLLFNMFIKSSVSLICFHF